MNYSLFRQQFCGYLSYLSHNMNKPSLIFPVSMKTKAVYNKINRQLSLKSTGMISIPLEIPVFYIRWRTRSHVY